MNKNKVYLCGTSILPEGPMDRPVIFLVCSALNEALKLRLQDSGYEVLPNIWSGRESLNNANNYLDRVYEKLSRNIGLCLNQIHGTAYPYNFWEIPMASWLLQYLHASFDRYSRLKKAIESFGKHNVTFLACDLNFRPPSSYSEFSDLTCISDEGASYFYGQIAKEMGIEVLEFISTNQPQAMQPVIKKTTHNLVQDLYCKFFRKFKDELLNPMLLWIFRRNNILMVPYVFNKKEKFIFAKELKASFFCSRKIRIKEQEIDRSILLSIKATDEFENILIKLLPIFLPTYLLEEFQGYRKEALRWSGFNAYFATAHWYSDIVFGYAAALARLRHAKIIGCQHGGGYGQFEKSSPEYIERKFSDFYITWGWNDSLYQGAKLLPLPQPFLSHNLNLHKFKLENVLLSSTTMQKQLVRFATYIPDVFSQYLEDKNKFIAHLDKEIRFCLIYRPYPKDLGLLSQEKNIFSKYPEVKLDTDCPFPETLKKVKLYICDHQSTSFMQAFATNTPTILFWSPELMSERETASSTFGLLRKSGILFHDSVLAAQQVNTIWSDVAGWWQHPERQNARSTFMNNFAKADRNWQREWIETIKANINC